MSRQWVVPWLVVALFLSGCKSAQQGDTDAATHAVNGVEDSWGNACQRCSDWLETHPTARGVVYVAGFVALTAAIVTLVVVCLVAESRDDH